MSHCTVNSIFMTEFHNSIYIYRIMEIIGPYDLHP